MAARPLNEEQIEIIEALVKKGTMTQYEIAEAAECSQATVCQYLKKKASREREQDE